MKVAIRSVIKTSYKGFECFEEKQIIFRAGRTLCIKEMGKPECEFICLSKNMDVLLGFKLSNNKKNVFTAERVGREIELAMYALSGEKKVIALNEQNVFLAQIDKVQLLVDEYDSNLLYGSIWSKGTSCVFLADFGKNKLMAVGYLNEFQDIRVDCRENMTVSVCGYNGTHNYIKRLQYGSGQWEISQQLIKKIHSNVFQHLLLIGGRCLLVTKTALYILEDFQLVKTIELSEKGEIVEVIKIPRGLIVKLQNDVLKLLVDDSDQISFVQAGVLRLQLQQGDKIQQLRVSMNSEQVWLRSCRNNFYVWGCDTIGLQINPSDLVFVKVDGSCSVDGQGSISLSADKKYALLVGQNSIILWSIERNQIVLGNQFTDPVQPHKKTIFAGAINPDGNSITIAFEDKVKVFMILFTKFKLIVEFPIKRCQNVVYSNGGQFVACRYGRGVNSCIAIINLLRQAELCTFKIQGEPNQIVWNQLDDQLIVSTESNMIQIYRIAEHARTHNIKVDETITHVRVDYKTRKLLVSTLSKILVVEGGSIIEVIRSPLQDFHYIFPLYGAYFAVARSGLLYWSYSMKFETFNEFVLFEKKPFNLLCRGGNLIAYSSFRDITVLRCNKHNEGQRKQLSEQIVLIQKDEILSMFDKMREIEGKFEILNSTYGMKLEEERQNYESAVQRLQSKYSSQINFSHVKYHQLSVSKLKQQKQSEKMFQEMQRGQLKSVDEIENMYQRKCKFEKEKYMNLEQSTLQQKMTYEEMFKYLQSKYHREVEMIRQEYAGKLKIQNTRMEKVKQNHLHDKKRIEIQLLDLEEENEVTLKEIQITKDTVIDQLKNQHKYLQECNEKVLIQLEAQGNHVQQLDRRASDSMNQFKKLEQKLRETQNRVKLLEGESKRKDVMISERDQIITEQAHQIGGLEKAKYVLSFRTTQIRKELQPKEGLIDKLKSELSKLDEQYRELKKKNYQVEQKMQKIETINEICKRQNSDLKISLKYKQRLHDELCSQIFMVINTVDPKDWNGEFVKIYQNFIKEDKHKNSHKKKDDTSEEINRHLMHVEQSLIQVTSGTDRIMKGKEKEVIRKMKENSELVYELNVMRKKENQFLKEKKELVNENARLKREATQSVRPTTRTFTANTGITRRQPVSRQTYTRDKTVTLDYSEFISSKREMKKERSRLASARRTLMLQDDIKQKSGKFFDIAKELQAAKSTIMRQDRMIEELNQQLLSMPEIENSQQ